MNDTKNTPESFNEIKLYKPKAVRLCPTRKNKKTPHSSSSSSSNSDKSQNQFNSEDSKNIFTSLDKISIEEINNDFFIYGQNLEEEECQNELLNILNSPKNNETDSDGENTPKIKRCRNPYEKNFDNIEDSYFNNLINELNTMYSTPME